MPQHPGKGQDDQALAAMEQMLAGGSPGAPPMVTGGQGDTPMPSNEEGDVVAALVMENVQLRQLLGLGPDDPIPPLTGGAPEAPGAPPAAPPGGAGLPPV